MFKRNVPERFDYARRITPDMSVGLVEDLKIDLKEQSPIDSVLKQVYAPDPVSGLPTGDLSLYLSDKTNPEIKNFILHNLLNDVSAAAMPKAPLSMSDSDILVLSRNPGESREAYANRMQSEISNFKALVDEWQKSVVSPSGVQMSASE